MGYKGIIIEESLEDASVLKGVKTIKVEVEPVTDRHKTPWVKQWTMREVEIPEDEAEEFSLALSKGFDRNHSWYADFQNEDFHYIVFRNRVFKVDLTDPVEYEAAKKYGVSLGIPEHQVDFPFNE